MSQQHAFYAPSASSRWLSCTASMTIDVSHLARTTSQAAELGTALHECGELLLQDMFTPKQAIGKTFNGCKITKEHIDRILVPYVDFVKQECGDGEYELLTEVKSVLVADSCWGTADAVIVMFHSDNTVTVKIIDLKTGSGYKVSPVNNPQLMMYAAGVYADLSLLYDIRDIHIGICQPPYDVYALRKIKPAELEKFTTQVIDTIDRIENGDVEFVPSEDNCRWCPAKSICPKMQDMANAAAASDFKKLGRASAKSLAEQLAMIPILDSWAAAVKAEIASRLTHGKKVKGCKLVKGRTSRAWKYSEDALLKKLQSLKIPKTWAYSEKLLSPPQLESLLKEKNKDPALISSLIDIVPGAPVVAREDDSRDAYDPDQAAQDDFAGLKKGKK